MLPTMQIAPVNRLSDRDLEILQALERCPLTAGQLLKLSRTFKRPFTSERRVRERMQTLTQNNWAWRWLYATAGGGSVNYYTLSRLGYRLLYGKEEITVPRRAFGPVSLAYQHHTRSLADFIVQTAVAAHRAGYSFTGFCRENTINIEIGTDRLFPDCAFKLVSPEGEERSFLVELDNRTERVRSAKEVQSWERKLRLYDAYQDQCPFRFRVLIVTTRSRERLQHILEAARQIQRNPERALFYGVNLETYLTIPDAVTIPCFRDHRGEPVSLVPGPLEAATKPSNQPLVKPVILR